MRERKDKSFPNYVTTADAVCHSIQFPVTQMDLLQALVTIYRYFVTKFVLLSR